MGITGDIVFLLFLMSMILVIFMIVMYNFKVKFIVYVTLLFTCNIIGRFVLKEVNKTQGNLTLNGCIHTKVVGGLLMLYSFEKNSLK